MDAEIETLRVLAASSPDVMFRKRWLPTHRFEYLSAGWTRLTGYTPEEVYRHPEHTMVAAECDAASEHLQRGSTAPFELHVTRKDGGVILVETTSIPIYDARGRVVASHGLMRDITQRRRAERAQRLLVELGTVLTSTLELQPVLQRTAELALEHLADICVIELVEGTSIRHRAAAHRDPEILDMVRRTPTERRPLLARVVDRRSSLLISSLGSSELVEGWQDMPVVAANILRRTSYIGVPLWTRGQVSGALHLGSTAQHRRYDAEDLALADEIARRISMAIENSQLYAASQRGIKVRDEILSVVAHDLRNPLSAIQLSAENLQHASADPLRARRTLASITKAVDRADGLIQNLLDVTRIDGRGLELDRAAIDPASVVEEAVDAMTPVATAASVEIRPVVEPGLRPIHVDMRRMAQVFSNLIGNAIKFIGPSGGLVELRAWPDSDTVHFEVRDTGPGIAEHEIPRLFDRFWQGSRNDRRGAGLGLPITKGIIDAHGGEIWVVSEVGRGTTFHITLPVVASHDERLTRSG